MEENKKQETTLDDDYILNRLLKGDTTDEICAALAQSERIEYDESFILSKLMLGKTREEIANMLNHQSYRTLDMFMRRHGYKWDSDKQTYVKKIEQRTEEDLTPTPNKVKQILDLFASNMDPREIAIKVGMGDLKSLAEYMKSKGYYWNPDTKNYALKKGNISNINFKEPTNSIETTVENNLTENIIPPSNTDTDNLTTNKLSRLEKLEQLIPMLEMISHNKDRLAKILSLNEIGTIPRYVVGGVTITKSLCMSHNLSQLIKDFSVEKNISQKEIFEVAIIDFLKKYGYENEINALFK